MVTNISDQDKILMTEVGGDFGELLLLSFHFPAYPVIIQGPQNWLSELNLGAPMCLRCGVHHSRQPGLCVGLLRGPLPAQLLPQGVALNLQVPRLT